MTMLPQELEYDFPGSESVLCRIKAGWEGADKEGQYFGRIAVNGTFWAIVLWNGDDDPELFKSAGLEVAQTKFVDLSAL